MSINKPNTKHPTSSAHPALNPGKPARGKGAVKATFKRDLTLVTRDSACFALGYD
ncbi:MAG: hypothetical protein HWE39_02930 [Oceanospirillaceae bacterium]|nr:hypothetical protein [Oceanospirillaceae bacterium]